MRNILNITSRVLTILIIAFGVVYTFIVISNADTLTANSNEMNMLAIVSFIILGITVVSLLIFSIVSWLSEPRKAVRGLIGIAVMAIIAIISYSIATPDIDPEFANKMQQHLKVTPAMSKMVGAALIGTFIIGGLAILAIIYSGVQPWISKLLKK